MTYTLSAFKRARFVEAGGMLVLETDHDREQALDAFERAIGASNDGFVEMEERGLWARVNAPVPTPDGPMALVTECEPARALTLMLETVARRLEKVGISGKLRPANQFIDYYFENNSLPALGVFVTLPVDEAALLASYEPWMKRPSAIAWLVDPDVTRGVAEPSLAWVLDVDGPVQVWVGATRFRMDPESVVDFVVDVLPLDHMVRVGRGPGQGRRRSVRFSEFGCLSIANYDVNLGRREHLAELIDVMGSIARNATTAFVRETSASAGTRELLRTLPPTNELVETVRNSFWTLPHLEADYVYDAYVAQVLTGSQLAKTSNLSSERWDVVDIGADRHFVVHREPDLWLEDDARPYGERLGARVSPEVLAQARADFGEAIMTAQTLEEHPPDLPHDELVRALGVFHLTPRI